MDIETFLKKKAEYKEALADWCVSMMQEFFAEFFTNNPNIDEVMWLQYTPWFNDGEACVFGIHEVNYRAVGTERKEDIGSPYEPEGFFSRYSFNDKELDISREEADRLRNWEDKFNALEDILASLGDHSMISVRRNNGDPIVEVTEHEHD